MANIAEVSEVDQSMLVFRLGAHNFCVSVFDVLAVIRSPDITRIFLTPDYVSGAFMFRDNVAVAIDLRKKLKVEGKKEGSHEAEYIVSALSSGQIVALEVDGVDNVLDSRSLDWQPLPANLRNSAFDKCAVKDGVMYIHTSTEALCEMNGGTGDIQLNVNSMSELEALQEQQAGQAAPEVTSAQVPGQIPEQSPEQISEQASEEIPEQTPTQIPEQAQKQQIEDQAPGDAPAWSAAGRESIVPEGNQVIGTTAVEAVNDEMKVDSVLSAGEMPGDTALQQPVTEASDTGPTADSEEISYFAPTDVDGPEALNAEGPAAHSASESDAKEAPQPDVAAAETEATFAEAASPEPPPRQDDDGGEPAAAAAQAFHGHEEDDLPLVTEVAPQVADSSDASAVKVDEEEQQGAAAAFVADEDAAPAERPKPEIKTEIRRREPAGNGNGAAIDIKKVFAQGSQQEYGNSNRSAAIAIGILVLVVAVLAWFMMPGDNTTGGQDETAQMAAVTAAPTDELPTEESPTEESPTESATEAATGGQPDIVIESDTFKIEVHNNRSQAGTEPVPTQEAASEAPVKLTRSGQRQTHRVVEGDTLWAIAEKYLGNPYQYPALVEFNDIKNPDLIYPGDVVKIIKK